MMVRFQTLLALVSSASCATTAGGRGVLPHVHGRLRGEAVQVDLALRAPGLTVTPRGFQRLNRKCDGPLSQTLHSTSTCTAPLWQGETGGCPITYA